MSSDQLEAIEKKIEIQVELGDVIVIPAGVSHCSKNYTKNYRYVAAYPTNGEKYKSVGKGQVQRNEGKYDNHDDIEQSIKAAFPLGDPVCGKGPGSLVDIWTDKLKPTTMI